jgi:hypothetical protein
MVLDSVNSFLENVFFYKAADEIGRKWLGFNVIVLAAKFKLQSHTWYNITHLGDNAVQITIFPVAIMKKRSI